MKLEVWIMKFFVCKILVLKERYYGKEEIFNIDELTVFLIGFKY